jgi:hypothetical protein
MARRPPRLVRDEELDVIARTITTLPSDLRRAWLVRWLHVLQDLARGLERGEPVAAFRARTRESFGFFLKKHLPEAVHRDVLAGVRRRQRALAREAVAD